MRDRRVSDTWSVMSSIRKAMAPSGVRAAGDAVGQPGGQGPGLGIVAAGGALDHVVDLRAPGRVVPGLGQDLPVAQPVEEIQQAGTAAEKLDRQAGEVGHCRVEEHQPLVAVEDRKAGGQIGKGLGQRLDEGAAHGFGLDLPGDVNGIKDMTIPVPGRAQLEMPGRAGQRIGEGGPDAAVACAGGGGNEVGRLGL
ncbi:MAG: hypothetical protein M5U35_02090 [Roseovarius sp.]|nr:hypothetical protein [Roseovarius sp.]